MRLEYPAAATPSINVTSPQPGIGAGILAVAIFVALSLYCGIRSEGFIAADACTHYLAARYAWQNPINFVDVWNRPLVTILYAIPAWMGGRIAVRMVCMLVAVGCGIVGFSIARGQGLKRPVLALIFTLGQPLLFLHSFGEMTELPFALVLGLAFLAWQNERFWLAAILVAWTPLARPEGVGFLAIAVLGLLLNRKWLHLFVLPIPLVLWDLAGWVISHHSHPWWRWLPDSWPYSSGSMYGRGYLLTFVALLPAVVSPAVLPTVILGIWRSITNLVPSPPYSGEREPEVPTHLRLCIFLTAALPLFVLVVHSLLYWLGKMASFGEARYLLVVAPFWGVLAARGWEWIWNFLSWRHPLRWATAAALSPIILNFVHPVVPVGLSHDWQSAREMARWYQGYWPNTAHHAVIAAHPGIAYFLGTNPHDFPDMGPGSLRDSPPGTVLIWDPIFSETNASADCALTLNEIRQAGWKEIPAPDPYESNPDSVHETARDPNDPRSHWHVFVNGE